jgi:8-hydroxy-5-deazaflavin:NADPH oxidoreductase
MKIAVLGTGHVGKALGIGWAKKGHELFFGVREPASENALQLASEAHSAVVSVAEAAASAEVIALAVPWTAVESVLHEVRMHIQGKLLIDCTNPTGGNWPKMDHSAGSGGEQVAQLVPEARVVKCFNTTGFENMQNPVYPDGAATMFYSGNDAATKKIVHQLAADLGFDPVDVGDLGQSHMLETLAGFWGTLAYKQKMGRGIAFRLLRK